MSAAMWRLAPLIGREGVRQPDAMHTKRVTRHLSYANVMATIGVFIALGGASYAAVALPAGSVGPKQLKKSAVAGSKIKRNAISSAKVKDGSLQRGDFASGTLLEGPQGLQGPKGDPGAQGPKGDPGPAGISGYEIVEGNGVGLNSGGEGLSFAYCPTGKKVVGGGVSGNARLAIIDSFPSGTTAWRVFARNVGVSPWSFVAYAICTKVD